MLAMISVSLGPPAYPDSSTAFGLWPAPRPLIGPRPWAGEEGGPDAPVTSLARDQTPNGPRGSGTRSSVLKTQNEPNATTTATTTATHGRRRSTTPTRSTRSAAIVIR